MDQDEDNDESLLSQDGKNINKVHLKFYCNFHGIEVKGLERIKNLVDNISSNEKSQENILQD